MRPELFLIPLLLSSAGCKETRGEAAADHPPSPVVNVSATSTTATATATASARSEGGKGAAVAVAQDTGTYEFEYSYPATAGGHAPLKEYLDRNLAETRTALVKDATEWRDETQREGFPFHPYSSSTRWQVVTDLPGWLSLSVATATYSGGAHGITGKGSLLYDKRAATIRKPLDLFRSPEALWQAVEKRWCAGLDREREKRRGEPVNRTDDFLGGCPKLDELTVLLGSSGGKTFDRLTLYAGPYVAGPYAEGSYEVNLDFDAAVVAAVKPEFAKDFSVHR